MGLRQKIDQILENEQKLSKVVLIVDLDGILGHYFVNLDQELEEALQNRDKLISRMTKELESFASSRGVGMKILKNDEDDLEFTFFGFISEIEDIARNYVEGFATMEYYYGGDQEPSEVEKLKSEEEFSKKQHGSLIAKI